MRIPFIAAACVLTVACGGGRELGSTPTAPSRSLDDHVQVPWEKPVRKAICRAEDRVETGLQGQVPLVDRVSGRSQQGYNCNLDLVGQWQGDGASWQMAWYDDCAYYGTKRNDARERPGVVVIDASNRTNPRPSAYLTTTPMLDPWESLKVNEKRAMLGAVDGQEGGGGNQFDLYDLSGGCTHPELLANAEMADTSGHEGNFSQDGLTYYSSSTGDYSAFDISDPTNPEYMLTWTTPAASTHGLSTNEDGTRAYVVSLGLASGASGSTDNGLVIYDTTDIQNRAENPEVPIISETYWLDGSETAQHTLPIKINGVPHIVFVDEAGISGKNCASGLSPFAFARIFDISDEANPQLTAKLMLETHDPANCATVLADYPGQVLFGYDSHYCTADDPENAQALACGYFNSGIRVFDIRDPYFPREIAYYNPPAQVGKQDQLSGSQHAAGDLGGLGQGVQMTADWCSAQIRFVRERGELWGTCQDNGFMILQFADNVWPFNDSD